ncbi:MAG: HK97 family phage prohead protease [Pseudomonadota bacterium]
MLEGGAIGTLEVREGGGAPLRLHGRFPYNKTAILSDGGRTGRPKKERIAPGGFRYRVNRPAEEIYILVGHDFNRPLASRSTGTLDLSDTPAALEFEARIAPELLSVSWVQDLLTMLRSGLMLGLSPGFRIPPKRAVPVAITTETESDRPARRPNNNPRDPVTIEDEPDDGTLDEDGNPRRGAIIRTIWEALLYELSVVTVPAYREANVDLRDWKLTQQNFSEAPDAGVRRVLNRWRP